MRRSVWSFQEKIWIFMCVCKKAWTLKLIAKNASWRVNYEWFFGFRHSNYDFRVIIYVGNYAQFFEHLRYLVTKDRNCRYDEITNFRNYVTTLCQTLRRVPVKKLMLNARTDFCDWKVAFNPLNSLRFKWFNQLTINPVPVLIFKIVLVPVPDYRSLKLIKENNC
jgi:hypothetical protein